MKNLLVLVLVLAETASLSGLHKENGEKEIEGT